MSYAIEYDKQFILSQKGITPLWLAGDNNVYETDRKRSRDWTVFHNLVGVNQEEILDSIRPSLGGYQEHWMKNGKWIDDAALIRWVKNGCKNAASIEEIIAMNPFNSVACKIIYYTKDDKRRTVCEYFVHNTSEFDDWIDSYRAIRNTLKENGIKYIFPHISFWAEEISHPTCQQSDYILIKSGNMYLSRYQSDGVQWNRDINEAMIVDRKTVFKLLPNISRYTQGNKMCFIDAKKIEKESFSAAIRFTSGMYNGLYVRKVCPHHIDISRTYSNAHHYSSKSTAKKALNQLQMKYGKYGDLEIVVNEGE